LTSTHFLVKQKSICFPSAVLEGEEHHHLGKVLRIKPGKRVWLIDEEGERYLAEVIEVGKHQTKLNILEKAEKPETKIHLTLAQALIKSKKMDFLIQKATELGMTFFIPVVASRSVVRIQQKEAKKVERWQKIAAGAAKQSRRSFVPSVQPPQRYRSFIMSRHETRRLLLCEALGRYLREILAEVPGSPTNGGIPSVIIAVGPEGGWAKEEVRFALENGFEAVSLGNEVLRSETAALAALAMISHFWST
jgi:16S rRNA (uracil1498-N3)-methyltransferase